MPVDATYFDSEFDSTFSSNPYGTHICRSCSSTASRDSHLSQMYADAMTFGGFGTLYWGFHGGGPPVHDDLSQQSTVAIGSCIYIGNRSINATNLNLLQPFRNRIGVLYLFACYIATAQRFGVAPQYNGYDLCRNLARTLNTTVYASPDEQVARLAARRIFNGVAYQFNPNCTVRVVQSFSPEH